MGILEAPVLGSRAGVNALTLKSWRKARARMQAGIADAKILCIGDSTTAGIGNDAAPLAGGSSAAYPAQFAAILNARGVPAARGLGIPNPSTGSAIDPRWTLGSGWSNPGNLGWAGFSCYQAAAGAAGNLTYADPTVMADKFDIYYLGNSPTSPALGTITATATGGSPVAVSSAVSPGVYKMTVTAGSAATSNVLTMTNSGGQRIFIVGVEPYLSTTRKVRVGNAGLSGSKLFADWNKAITPSAFGSSGSIQAYAPDLTIISLGINDANVSLSEANFTTALSAIVNSAAISGDVWLMSPIPPSSAAAAAVKTYVPLYAEIMRTFGRPYANLSARWVNGDDSTAYGYMWDALHPSSTGYADIAFFLATALLTV